MLTASVPPAAPTAVQGGRESDCRAAARAGDLSGAWAVLLAATGAADPVLGPRGHGLRPTTVDADLASAGTGWRLLRAAGPDNRPEGWVPALTWLRLGVCEWLLSRAVDYLRARESGGVPLIHQQLVRGHLADAAIEQLEVLGVLRAHPPHELSAPLATRLHAQITRADRVTLRLLGASGFLAEGPGQVGYLSELLADAYLDAAAPHPEELR